MTANPTQPGSMQGDGGLLGGGQALRGQLWHRTEHAGRCDDGGTGRSGERGALLRGGGADGGLVHGLVERMRTGPTRDQPR